VDHKLVRLVEPLVAAITDAVGQDQNAVEQFQQDGRTIIRAVLAGAGDGRHHITVATEFGSATVVADVRGDSAHLGTDHPALLVWMHLGAAQATQTAAGITLRSTTDTDSEVRAWLLATDGDIHPQSEAEVFAACCTDADTGDPIAPEHAVRYCSAYPLEA
jgi:hypothetical protein